MARSPCRWLGGLLLAVTFGATGCGTGPAAGEGCGPLTREAIDPAYLVHVVADDPNVEYSSDPPTSGPHQPAPPVAGVTDDPISRPVQVGILERGDVLLQYDPDLDPGSVATLHALAGDAVVVAPNPDLPAPVVATAWLFKRTCRTVDPDDLQTFVDERRGRGPEG